LSGGCWSSRNSSFSYKGKSVDVRQVGRELGARYVLEGGVRKAGNRVRIPRSLLTRRADTMCRQSATTGHSKPNPMPESVTDRCTKTHE